MASVGSVVLAASAATIALANIPAADPAFEAGDTDYASEAAAALLPSPVADVTLFADAKAADEGRCMTGADVVAELDRDRATLGGETVLLADGLEQDFSDVWRRQAGVEAAKVSGIVAHLFHDETGSAIADIVEFDTAGCAISRTMISGDDWNLILSAAAGEEA